MNKPINLKIVRYTSALAYKQMYVSGLYYEVRKKCIYYDGPLNGIIALEMANND